MSKKKYQITAIAYDRKGQILSIGTNSYTKTHPLQKRFSTSAGSPEKQYLHAEVAALIKARKPVYKLLITRFDAAGNPVSAKPCSACQKAIAYFGVKVVEHT